MPHLVDYGISYGECVGYCATLLRIEGSRLELIQTSKDPRDAQRRYAGAIEKGLGDKIISAVAKIDPDQLLAVYGEPDSRDEGAVTLRIRGAGGTTTHEYSRGTPPAQLSEVDELLRPILTGWLDGEPVPGVSVVGSP